jgi:hypothetical protein
MARQNVQSLTLPSGLTISVGQRVICKTGDEYFDGRPCLIFEIYKNAGDGRFYIAGELQKPYTPGPSFPRGPRFENVFTGYITGVA